jgi:uncharacterized protein
VPTPEPVSVLAPGLPAPRLLRQQWRDVAFVHWAVDPARVSGLLPPGVEVDVYEGRSYVGLVAFRMVGSGFARGPALPWLGTFLETNVRLYSVDATGRRGVVFLSLDADRLPVVGAARAAFALPYRWARMRFARSGPERAYQATLRRPFGSARSRLRIRARDEELDGPLERFLTARWGLHVAHLGRTWFLPNAHEPWPLRAAELIELDDELLGSVGFGELAGRTPDHVAFSAGVHSTFGRPLPAGR